MTLNFIRFIDKLICSSARNPLYVLEVALFSDRKLGCDVINVDMDGALVLTC